VRWPATTTRTSQYSPYRFVRAVVQVSSIGARALLVVLGDLVRDGVGASFHPPSKRLDLISSTGSFPIALYWFRTASPLDPAFTVRHALS
jgi:hypothetical protein